MKAVPETIGECRAELLVRAKEKVRNYREFLTFGLVLLGESWGEVADWAQ